VRERVEWVASRLRASGSTFRVVEDESRVRFELEVWGPLRTALAPAGWERGHLWLRDGDRVHYPRGGGSSAAWIVAVERLLLDGVVEIGPGWLDVPKDSAARAFSDEALARLGTPLALQVEAAAGDWERLLAISASMDRELVCAKDPLGILIAGLLTWIARERGEPVVEEALMRSAEAVMGDFVRSVERLGAAASVRAWASAWRAHGSTFWIEEHEDVVLFRGSPLGACHRMWAPARDGFERVSESRVRYPTFGCYDPPASFHRMCEASALTAGRTGYPVYSCHCHVFHELYPLDRIGRVLWVERHPLDDPYGDTVHVHDKRGG
jgi:hypothetical protein